MSLTVPVAGTEAGRSSRPDFVLRGATDVPQTGAMLADFGAQVKGLGDRIEADRLENEMGRLQLDTTKDLYALRKEAEAIGDPDQLESFWSSGVQRLKQDYLTGQSENGRPRVDPKLRAKFDLGFDDMAWRHAAALGQDAAVRRRVRKITGLADFEAVAGAQAAETDPGTREELVARHGTRVDQLVADGLLTPDDASAKKAEFQTRVEAANLTALIAEDPQAVLDGIDAGVWPGLDAGAKAEWSTKAQAALAAKDSAAARGLDVGARQRDAVVKADLSALSEVLAKGDAAPAEALLHDPDIALKFPDLVSRGKGAVALRDAGVNLSQMSLPELDALSRDVMTGKIAARAKEDALAVIDARAEATRRALDRDPVGFAEGVGLPVPTLDLTDAATIAEGLDRRAVFADWLMEAGYTAAPAFLSLSERRQIGAALSQSPDLKAAVATGIAERFGAAADRMLGELGVDALTRKIALAGGDPSVASAAEAALTARDAGDLKGVSDFLGRMATVPEADRAAVASALDAFNPNLGAAVTLAPDDASLARRVALGGMTDTGERDFTHVGDVAGKQAEGFARALDQAGVVDADLEALRRFGSPDVRAAVDPMLSDDEANARLVDSGLPPAALRKLWREAGPEPLRAPETPAERVEARLLSDPTARRLAEAQRFVPDSPEAVAAFDRDLREISALPAPERDAAVKLKIETAGQRQRAGLGRPLYYGGGEVTLAGLKDAARRVVEAHRSGRMDAATYEAQAVLIRDLAGAFHD